MRHKTLVYHNGALGDLLLSLPAIKIIKERSGWVHLVGRPNAAMLLRQMGEVVDTSSSDSSLFTSLYAGEPDERIREFLMGFDDAVMFSSRNDTAVAQAIRLTVKETQTVLTLPPREACIHVAEYRWGQVAYPDLEARATLYPLIKIPPAHDARARQFLRRAYPQCGRPLIALHPGSGGRRKCWPVDSYFRLMTDLVRVCNAWLLVFSGPAEGRLAGPIEDHISKHRERILHVAGTDLPLVAALLNRSDLYIGNDSGISHLAAAVGTPVVTVFGPTDPVLWRPVGGKIIVIASKSACAPCGDELSRKCGYRRCLADIEVGKVLKETERLLAEINREGKR